MLAPFWNAVADQGLFAAVHGSFGSHMPSFASSRYKNTFFTHMICTDQTTGLQMAIGEQAIITAGKPEIITHVPRQPIIHHGGA